MSWARGRVGDERWVGPVRKARMKGGLNIQGGVGVELAHVQII